MIPEVFKNAALWYKLWKKLPDLPDKGLSLGRKYKEFVFDYQGELASIWFDSSFTYSDHRRPFGVLEIHAFIQHPSIEKFSFYICYRERHRQVAYAKGDNIKPDRYYSRLLPRIKKRDIEAVEHLLTILFLTVGE